MTAHDTLVDLWLDHRCYRVPHAVAAHMKTLADLVGNLARQCAEQQKRLERAEAGK